MTPDGGLCETVVSEPRPGEHEDLLLGRVIVREGSARMRGTGPGAGWGPPKPVASVRNPGAVRTARPRAQRASVVEGPPDPAPRPAPALGWLELLAIDNGGVEVPLAQPLDERAVRLGLNDPIELGAVGGDEAPTVDQHVVHLPAAVPQVHAIVEQDLGPPLGEHLGAHRRVGAVDRLA